MRNLINRLLMIGVIPMMFACQTDDIGQVPRQEDNIGAVTEVTVNPNRNFYNALNALTDEFIEFELDVDGFGVNTVTSVDLYVVYTDLDGDVDPLTGEIIPLVYDRALLKSISSFPTTVQVTAQEAADMNGLSLNDLDAGDSFVLDFELNTEEGKTFTYALQSDLCNEPLQPGDCSVSWAITCPISAPFTGAYTVTDDQGLFGGTVNVTGSGTFRSFAGDWTLGSNVFDDTGFEFEIFCTITRVAEQSIGLGCGPSGDVNVATSGTPGSVDVADDSQFSIGITYTNPVCFGGFDSFLTFVKN